MARSWRTPSPNCPRESHAEKPLGRADTYLAPDMSAPAKRRSFERRPHAEPPKYHTTFVGRASDLVNIKTLIDRSHILTLTGPGGVGKTRLAAEAARSNADHWPDGICWVELVPVTDPAQMPWAVVQALELPGRGSAGEVASAWLASRKAIVVLDNCEHLVAACAAFAQELLQRCDELTIIATSREALGIAGEALWPLSPLSGPDAQQLFEARAQLVLPTFELADSNQQVVSEICERLDRLPLAVELAAARVGMMPEQDILRQLNQRFQLLRGGVRSAHRKSQSMSAAIEWSYHLLNEPEARLFRGLSVFRGGFTLESAEAVCGDKDSSVFDLVSSLVQKSMVMAERTEGSPGRYRLLESQLAYAEDQLRDSGDHERVQRAHYQFFTDRLASLRQRDPWISREIGNIWVALIWAGTAEPDFGLSLAACLPYDALGDMALFRKLLEDLLRRSHDKSPVRVRALSALAGSAYKQGDFAGAISVAEAGVALAREIGDVEGQAVLQHWIGAALEGTGDFKSAADAFETGLELISGSTNYPRLNMLRNAMADLYASMSDYPTARRLLEECLATAKLDGDIGRRAASLESLAWVDRGEGNYRGAAQCWQESLSLIRSGMIDRLLVIDNLEGLSIAAEALRDDRRALCLAGAANRMAGEMSYVVDPWWRKRYDDSHNLSQKRLGRVAADKARKRGAAMTWDEAIDYALGDRETGLPAERGPLSRRELEVAELVARGLTNRQIARELVIEERTAEGHVEHIRNKLGFTSRAQVATWFTEHRAPHR